MKLRTGARWNLLVRIIASYLYPYHRTVSVRAIHTHKLQVVNSVESTISPVHEPSIWASYSYKWRLIYNYFTQVQKDRQVAPEPLQVAESVSPKKECVIMPLSTRLPRLLFAPNREQWLNQPWIKVERFAEIALQEITWIPVPLDSEFVQLTYWTKF